VLTQQLQEPITESAQEDKYIHSKENNNNNSMPFLSVYQQQRAYDLQIRININKQKQVKTNLNSIHVIVLNTLSYRASILKGHIVFAENVQKSAYVICSNDSPS
jgi:hypothetical protein